jgi:anti-sigma factor RsiW
MSDCPHPYELQSLVDGALPAEEEARLRAHCLVCPTCGAQVAELERVHWLLRERAVEVPANLLQRILHLLTSVLPVRKIGCAEALEMASAYIDDELNQLERETLETHLFACDSCYVEYVAMRTAASAMREAPAVPVSEGLKSRILAAVAVEAAQEPAPALRLRPAFILPPVVRRAWAPGMAVAAVALMTLGVFHVMNGRSAQPAASAPQPAPVVAAMPSEEPPALEVTGAQPAPSQVPVPAPAVTAPAPTATKAAPPAGAAAAPPPPAKAPRDEAIPEIRLSDIRGASGPMPPAPRVIPAPAPRTAAASGGSGRRVAVVAPPAPRSDAPPAQTTPGPGLSTAERTASVRHNYRPEGFRVAPPPAMDTGSVGVIARRPLSGGESATRLTSVDDLEDTPAERLESRNWVRSAPPAETVYRNSGASNSHLAAMSERINRTAGTERKLSVVSETLGTN